MVCTSISSRIWIFSHCPNGLAIVVSARFSTHRKRCVTSKINKATPDSGDHDRGLLSVLPDELQYGSKDHQPSCVLWYRISTDADPNRRRFLSRSHSWRSHDFNWYSDKIHRRYTPGRLSRRPDFLPAQPDLRMVLFRYRVQCRCILCTPKSKT